MRGWEGVGWMIDEVLLRSGGLVLSPLDVGGLASCHVSAISLACAVGFLSGRCGVAVSGCINTSGIMWYLHASHIELVLESHISPN